MLNPFRAAEARPWQVNLIDPSTAQEAVATGEDSSEMLLRSWAVEEALRRLSEERRTALVQTPSVDAKGDHDTLRLLAWRWPWSTQ